ncbi:right-handed parallel beta-helix repeat-containing protein [Bifidobacterium sp. SO4]|uniref:right-handed parallel beta-helix repeat-containing protein n=1 Tax=Bifidobacterium sp. SO4 TaxID=2809030 RepID=UPI001BDCC45B|nr:right-handed parallel beta-helix repeat-containing protein [Bifidobacterium sp. SO4]MBT1170975.1 hypothetical protein [Bifidobacterium sp. SO4]
MMRNVDVARRMRAGAAAVACSAMLAGGLAVAANAADPVACTADSWETLRTCVGTEGDVTVSVTAMIQAGDDTLQVAAGAKTLSAADGMGVEGAAGRERADSVFSVPAGASLTIEGGTYRNLTAVGANNLGGNGALVYSEGNVTVKGGTFEHNTARNGGVFFMQSGDLAIEDGKFENNTATAFVNDKDTTKGGGVAYAKGGLTVSGGSFTGNTAAGNGGVLYNTGSTTTISGGSFTGNSTTGSSGQGGGVLYAAAGSTTVLDGDFEDNTTAKRGGGALYQAAGSMTVSAGTFKGNSTTNTGSRGGGAILMEGELKISGGTFEGNSTATNRRFSGGGAVYSQGRLTVQDEPVFKDNWAHQGAYGELAKTAGGSGGAGGAIFLQENSTAFLLGGSFTGNESGYLGGAVYTEEHSLSYIGKAVATGNTAGHFGGGLWLCPSGVGSASKSGNIALYNNSLDPSLDANRESGGKAGSDFAMMNPSNKKIDQTTFELMDSWFTDRNNPAVKWRWDGEPARDADGFTAGTFKLNADPTHKTGDVQKAGTIELNGTDNFGIALKAEVLPTTSTDNAYRTAALTFTGNKSQWSGGAIGSNGTLSFSSPYTAAWNKVDTDATSTYLAGSSWRLTTKDPTKTDDKVGGGDLTSGLSEGCDAAAKGEQNLCWIHRDGDAADEMSLIIVDNGPRDNNSDDGRFSVDNLKPAQYWLTEESQPANHAKSTAVYTFTITEGQTKTPALSVVDGKADANAPLVADPNGEKRSIGNKAIGGLNWIKVKTGTSERLAGSEWTIKGAEDSNKDYSLTVTDCVASQTVKCDGTDDSHDTDGDMGEFAVSGLAAGEYTLTESKAPDGYVLDQTAYTFDITNDPDTVVKLKVNGTEMTTNAIGNKPTEVSWTKVGSDNANKALPGSTWKLTRTNADDTSETVYKNIVDCAPGEDGKAPTCEGSDMDGAAGKFKLTGLTAGSYTLTETKAPDGFVKSDTSYTFTISDEGVVSVITGANDNKIINTKMVTALPLTGGSALDWLVTGGVLAILALASALVMSRMRGQADAR